MAKKGGHRTKSKPGSGSKIKNTSAGRDTKRRRRDVEQVFDDMTKKEQLETAQPFDDDLPGCGQFYCVETARYFVDQKALDDHKKSRAYKRRVKELKEETPFTQKDAEAAAGMTKERLPSAAESRAKAEAKKGRRMTDDD